MPTCSGLVVAAASAGADSRFSATRVEPAGAGGASGDCRLQISIALDEKSSWSGRCPEDARIRPSWQSPPAADAITVKRDWRSESPGRSLQVLAARPDARRIAWRRGRWKAWPPRRHRAWKLVRNNRNGFGMRRQYRALLQQEFPRPATARWWNGRPTVIVQSQPAIAFSADADRGRPASP